MSEALSGLGVLVAAFLAFLLYKDRDDIAESTSGDRTQDPTPPSNPATTISAPPAVERWINEATRAANLTGVDRNLILAIIWQESGGDPEAVGSAGEQGLMQVTEIAASDVGESLPSTDDPPQRQITVGAKYLKKCAEYVGQASTYKQLRCYNEGPPPLTQRASESYASQVLEKRERMNDGG